MLRASGSPGSETCLYIILNGNGSSTAGGFVDGSLISGGIGTMTSSAIMANQTGRARIRVAGDQLTMKTWVKGDAEPAWSNALTLPGGLAGAGWVGFYNGASATPVGVDWFSVAVGGGTAPNPED